MNTQSEGSRSARHSTGRVDCQQGDGLPPTARSAKIGHDWRDLVLMLLTFPALKCDHGPVGECLQAAGAAPEVLAAWKALVAQDIRRTQEDEAF